MMFSDETVKEWVILIEPDSTLEQYQPVTESVVRMVIRVITNGLSKALELRVRVEGLLDVAKEVKLGNTKDEQGSFRRWSSGKSINDHVGGASLILNGVFVTQQL